MRRKFENIAIPLFLFGLYCFMGFLVLFIDKKELEKTKKQREARKRRLERRAQMQVRLA